MYLTIKQCIKFISSLIIKLSPIKQKSKEFISLYLKGEPKERFFCLIPILVPPFSKKGD